MRCVCYGIFVLICRLVSVNMFRESYCLLAFLRLISGNNAP